MAGSSAFARPVAAYSEVPVVPEADSVALLLGGLLSLGVVAGWRARRER